MVLNRLEEFNSNAEALKSRLHEKKQEIAASSNCVRVIKTGATVYNAASTVGVLAAPFTGCLSLLSSTPFALASACSSLITVGCDVYDGTQPV